MGVRLKTQWSLRPIQGIGSPMVFASHPRHITCICPELVQLLTTTHVVLVILYVPLELLFKAIVSTSYCHRVNKRVNVSLH